MSNKNIYELMENDQGEVMALIYAGDEAPENPTYIINAPQQFLDINRNKKEVIRIEGLTPETITKLQTLSVLYVCEIKYNQNPDDENQIVYAYAASLEKNTEEKPTKQQSISEKARLSREKAQASKENKTSSSKK